MYMYMYVQVIITHYNIVPNVHVHAIMFLEKENSQFANIRHSLVLQWHTWQS